MAGKNTLQRNAIIALANGHDKSALVKLMEIIDKNNNPIHTATAIWALGEIVKKPTQELYDFILSIHSDNDAIIKERTALLNRWQF